MSSSEPLTKLDEQRAKGYTAWDRTVDNPVPIQEPQKIDTDTAKQMEEQIREKSVGGSAWNAAGMFEEKGHMSWLKEALTARVQRGDIQASHSGSRVVVTEVESMEGHCSVVFSRGKKKSGFLLDCLKLKYEGTTAGGAEVKGTVTVTEVNSDDLDDAELAIDNAALRGVGSAMKESLRTVLGDLAEELKAR